jgi:asparagine synthase (glutamine-hydrolysing)
MCGIAGIVSLSATSAAPERDRLVRMAAALRHRGPDEFGLYRDDRAGLAHARLAIIDVHSGQQPMADVNGACWIVFNGEVYNHVELRTELIRQGCQFRTQSDTEVIIQAYRTWGNAAFERFNGQWAVALWDVAAKQLVLARDPVGICPLHYGEHGGQLYFASEVKAIFAANPSFPRAFDPVGLAQTFTFWSIVPPQSVYQGIHELRPGHVRTYAANGAVTDVAFYQPRYPQHPQNQGQFKGSVDDAAAAVKHALEQATALRMTRADVPVGSYLSGGLDSSLVAAMGQRFAGKQFKTFSLRFDDAEYDETGFQRLMAKRLGSDHHEVVVSRQDIANVFAQVVWHAERPVLRTAPAPLFMLSRLVRAQGIKVVLTGEGADEMFAGYDLFREGKVRRFWGRQAHSTWRHRLLERLYPYLARSPVSQQAMAKQFFGRGLEHHQSPGFAHATRWHTTSALQRLLSPDMRAAIEASGQADVTASFMDQLPTGFPQWDALAQDQHIEISTLLSGYLMSSQGDRMLLGNSVEGRFPFLDPEVMALAQSLPSAYKLRVLDEKHVVKRAAQDWVPQAIVNRQKQPYRAPDALSFVTPNAPDYVAHAFSESALKDAQVFDVKAAHQLFQKCLKRGAQGQFSNADNMAFVGVLSTQLLHQQFINTTMDLPPALRLVTDIDRTSALT